MTRSCVCHDSCRSQTCACCCCRRPAAMSCRASSVALLRQRILWCVSLSLQQTATHCNTHCNTLQHTEYTLQHTATYTATYTATHCNTQVALTDSIEIGEMLSSQRRHLVSRTTLWEQLCSVRWHRGLTNRCKSEALRFWIQSYRVAARRRIVCREIASFRWSKTLGCILCVWRRGTHLTAPRRTHQRHQLVGLVFSSHEHFSHEHFTFLQPPEEVLGSPHQKCGVFLCGVCV